MAMICRKCGGIIPDLFFGGKYVDRSDCKNHTKSNIKDWNIEKNKD